MLLTILISLAQLGNNLIDLVASVFGTKVVLFLIDTLRQPRAMLSIVLVIWSSWVAAFDSFHTTPTFQEMARIGDETAWFVALSSVGSVSFSLWVIDYFSNSPTSARTLLGITAGSLVTTAWAIVCFTLAKANFASTATVIYSALTAFALVNVLEVAGILDILRDRISDLESR